MKVLKKLSRIFYVIALILGYASNSSAANISHVDPAFWWIGMKNPELQILVHGEKISNSKVKIDYPGVTVKEIVSVENPNYLFIYLDITKEARAGIINIEFIEDNETTVSDKKSVLNGELWDFLLPMCSI